MSEPQPGIVAPRRKVVLTYRFRGGEVRAITHVHSQNVNFGVYSNAADGPIASFWIPRDTCREFSAAVASAVRELRRDTSKGLARADQDEPSAVEAGEEPQPLSSHEQE